ncbi:nucleoside deaminase [Maridesulfovibrio sp.]|uniref:nucleoside deaminase n=1 Tax=Maridesulfovibrio sp. TaxID=2795000 RepID=UPI002A189744|nr:nucleoside deaminase [Maridesulfovibrio sp.]
MTNIIIKGNAPSKPPAGQSWRSMMDVAIREAFKARRDDEVPIGAALFDADGNLLACGSNNPLTTNDPSGHAEMNCIRAACRKTGNYRLPPDTILAVTLEPCIMCLGAIIHARVGGVIFGAPDPKAGAVVSNMDGTELPFANHRFWAIGGVSGQECKEILQSFFLQKRRKD